MSSKIVMITIVFKDPDLSARHWIHFCCDVGVQQQQAGQKIAGSFQPGDIGGVSCVKSR